MYEHLRVGRFFLRWYEKGIGNQIGSRYNTKNVPNLYLNDDKPTLNNNWEDNANPKWGAPSCGIL